MNNVLCLFIRSRRTLLYIAKSSIRFDVSLVPSCKAAMNASTHLMFLSLKAGGKDRGYEIGLVILHHRYCLTQAAYNWDSIITPNLQASRWIIVQSMYNECIVVM